MGGPHPARGAPRRRRGADHPPQPRDPPDVAADRLPLEAGAIVPPRAGRTIFALPWLGSALLGTTDNDYEGDIDHVRPPDDDVAYLLDAINAFFGTDLGQRDVTGAFAGVRPLISRSDTKKSVDISRKAELYETPRA